jgi:hypothetical protein
LKIKHRPPARGLAAGQRCNGKPMFVWPAQIIVSSSATAKSQEDRRKTTIIINNDSYILKEVDLKPQQLS